MPGDPQPPTDERPGRGPAGEAVAHVYDQLRELAAAYLRRESEAVTLQPTALVHEAYLRLAKLAESPWRDEREFIGIAAHVMRQVLVDHARSRDALKRGGQHRRIELTVAVGLSAERGPSEVDLLALDEALAELASLNPRHARLVELRFFGGLSLDAAADILEISARTADSDWRMAKAWLHQALGDGHR
jgi:RNA polymerase sigma factor (TIGR02999 family)